MDGAVDSKNQANSILNDIISSKDNFTLLIEAFKDQTCDSRKKSAITLLLHRFFINVSTEFTPEEIDFILNFFLSLFFEENEDNLKYYTEIINNIVFNHMNYRQNIIDSLQSEKLSDISFEYLYSSIAQFVTLDEFSLFYTKLVQDLSNSKINNIAFENLFKSSYFLKKADILVSCKDEIKSSFYSIIQTKNSLILRTTFQWVLEFRAIDNYLPSYILSIDCLISTFNHEIYSDSCKVLVTLTIEEMLPYIIDKLSTDDLELIYTTITEFLCQNFQENPDQHIADDFIIPLIKVLNKDLLSQLIFPIIQELIQNQDLLYLGLCFIKNTIDISGPFDEAFDIILKSIQNDDQMIAYQAFVTLVAAKDYYLDEINENMELITDTIIKWLSNAQEIVTFQNFIVPVIFITEFKCDLSYFVRQILNFFMNIINSAKFDEIILDLIFTVISSINCNVKLYPEDIYQILVHFISFNLELSAESYLSALSEFIRSFPDYYDALFEESIKFSLQHKDIPACFYLWRNLLSILPSNDERMQVFTQLQQEIVETIDNFKENPLIFGNLLFFLTIYAKKQDYPEELIDLITSNFIVVVKSGEYLPIRLITQINMKLKKYYAKYPEKIEEQHFYQVVDFINKQIADKNNIKLEILSQYLGLLQVLEEEIGIVVLGDKVESFVTVLSDADFVLKEEIISNDEFLEFLFGFLSNVDDDANSPEISRILIDFSMNFINSPDSVLSNAFSLYNSFIYNKTLSDDQINMIYSKTIEILNSEFSDSLSGGCYFIQNMCEFYPQLIDSPSNLYNLLLNFANSIPDDSIHFSARDRIVMNILTLLCKNILNDVDINEIYSQINRFLPLHSEMDVIDICTQHLLNLFPHLSNQFQIQLFQQLLFVFSSPIFTKVSFDRMTIYNAYQIFNLQTRNTIENLIQNFGTSIEIYDNYYDYVK
ncbi:hypothetical protein TVAG_245930 [Trichomonas vaginalis G3]|uniref:Uncharacterized protein n=1 Tax=Trichomonas vaginalis (strain ATCC PRA-98 / G3) TaxID=412133 RepID=A2E4Q1_TRIV3|nr:armadillo (ARM) repeat-containing protein family [Trichomonas vaginalis G3]EAY12361.1 hypothetical protein TVAG_245930 [Trichomonas vaginalis G3]KAI5500779.1 armadillo (ARM) repeat-containing protein family [Trichomonas vaginalis G3]|eukprot:XP_001324584.1 hypothetical protein [Trichomonas vaginalis G3]